MFFDDIIIFMLISCMYMVDWSIVMRLCNTSIISTGHQIFIPFFAIVDYKYTLDWMLYYSCLCSLCILTGFETVFVIMIFSQADMFRILRNKTVPCSLVSVLGDPWWPLWMFPPSSSAPQIDACASYSRGPWGDSCCQWTCQDRTPGGCRPGLRSERERYLIKLLCLLRLLLKFALKIWMWKGC